MAHASLTSEKAVLRLRMRELRRQLASDAPDAAERVAALLHAEFLGRWRAIGGYQPQGAEIDPRPLMRRFAEAGAHIALPAAPDSNGPLTFRAYSTGDVLVPDAWGVPSPPDAAAIITPDLVIAPLLAFDRRGGRMGQGGGHYDRTLAALRARSPVFVLGLGYAGQEVAEVPHQAHDQRLDAILTEKAYIEVRKDS